VKPVVKIGGSLLKSAEDFVRAARFVVSQREPPVVVVSAMKGVTDALLELEKSRSISIYYEIARRHASVAEALGVLEATRAPLKELKDALKMPREAWTRDYFASFGERLSAIILHAVLRRLGTPAKLFTAPLLTDDNYGNAEPLALESADEIAEPGTVAVVTGYIGRSKEGRFTTVGRGGSDYVATFIGREIGSRRVSLITEALGVMTADPREVEGAEPLPLLSIYEALEAAKLGVKHFHPRTFVPLLDAASTVVEVRSYESRGTLIGHFYPPPPCKVVIRCEGGSYIIGLAAYELTKLGGVLLSRYAVRLNMAPRDAHELFIRPHLKTLFKR
jgi:aspartate kinase